MKLNLNLYLSAMRNVLQTHQVHKAYLFGSVCTENFNEQSDIDIIVTFNQRFFDGYVDNFLSLQKELSEIFKRPVDIITEESIQNPYFKQSIAKTITEIL